MKKQTVKDLEAKTGKPDSIRNPDGSNARSDQFISTLNKKLAKMVPTMTLPETMPEEITITFRINQPVYITDPAKVKQAAAVLHALGII